MDKRTDSRLSQLRKLWHESDHASQIDAAIVMGISQPAISQYLTGKINLNTDIIIKFANYLDVYPYEIDNELDWSNNERQLYNQTDDVSQ